MSEAPTEVWLRPGPTWDSYSTTAFPDQPDAVQYVRADLYDKWMAENVTEAPPAELWVSPGEGEYAGLWVEDEIGVLDQVRYVRADLYEALQARLEPLKSAGEAS